jgi:hypothetical protein
MHIFQRRLRHDAVLVLGPVIVDLGQHAVDLRVVAGARGAKPGISTRIDLAEAVDHRDRPGPRSFVDRRIEAELRQVERSRLQSRGHVDVGAALVDGEANIGPGHQRHAKTRNPTPGFPPVAGKVPLRRGG